MSPQTVVELGQSALTTILILAAPLLLAALVVGLVVGILQTVTSIQESTLTYVPKMVAVIVVFIVCLPWLSRTMVSFTTQLLVNLPQYAR